MTFELFDLEENPVLSDDLFRFEVPEGVEVLDERCPPRGGAAGLPAFRARW